MTAMQNIRDSTNVGDDLGNLYYHDDNNTQVLMGLLVGETFYSRNLSRDYSMGVATQKGRRTRKHFEER